MKFAETGLKQDKLVEEAFNYSYEYNRALAPELEAQFKQQIESQFQFQLDYLNDGKDSGQMTDDEYNLKKSRLEMQKDMQLKQLPKIVSQQLDLMFNATKLGPVLEVQNNSENTSASLLASALLLDCVRDPIDYQKVEAKFGSAVAGVIAEVLHIDSYPGQQDENLTKASNDAKRIFMAGLNSSLEQVTAQLKKLPPGQMLRFPPGQEENMFKQAKLLWGNDKKLDKRLVDVFNKAAEAMGSKYRIELGPTGTPELVETVKKTPPKMLPGPKKGPTIDGDDGF
jgi:hypothetical protein